MSQADELREITRQIRMARGLSPEPTPEEEEARDARCAARDAAERGEGCAECGRALTPTEPVYLLKALDLNTLNQHLKYYNRGLPGEAATNARLPICGDCAATFVTLPDTDTLPRCEVCSRPVAQLVDNRHRLYHLCSPRCRQRREQQRVSDVRRTLRASPTCPMCGETFTRKRSDAVTCSPKCRTALYRQRRRAGVA